ncbi:MAG TPA: TonB-dependent receptor [Cyclobacteriaceae bacterium]|nr:TonB-dependent receptor [Cyclobacteriaceae bacterium]
MTYRFLFFIFLISGSLYAQNKGSVKGIIKTSDGKPAANVNIALKELNRGSSSHVSGEFEIRNIEPGTYTLITSFIGLETKEQQVEVKAGEVTVVPEIMLSENAHELNEIVIKDYKTNSFDNKESEYVSKLPLKKLENPQVYSTISKELINEQLIFSVDDAIRNAPGVQKMWEATGRGGDGGAYYNTRGFILQSQLRNGVAGNVTSRVDVANLERVEIIKGPSATLFGSSLTTYGGLINRVTKKPFEKLGGEISYSSGSYGFNRVSADVNTPLDAEKKILLRTNVAYQNEGSFQDNGFAKSFAFAPSLSYKVNDRLSILLDAELYSGENSSKQIIFFYYPTSQLNATNPKELGIDYKRSYSANSIFQKSRSSNFFAKGDYKISEKWTSQTNFTSTNSFSDGPYAYFYVIPNSVVTGDANATGADYLVRADQSTANSTDQVTEIQQNFIGEFNVGNIKNRLVVGLDFYNQNSNQLFYGVEPFDIIKKNGTIPRYTDFNGDKLDSALQNGTPWNYPYRFKTSTYSAYISDVINLTDKLIALAAVRIDHFNNKGSYDQATGQYTGNYTQTAYSPKFGLVYQAIKDKISFFANYQNGFTNKTGTDYAGKTFKPEHANQIEGGVKLDAFNGKLSSTISYYNIEVSNIVRPYAANPNFSVQDGTQLNKGIEAEVIANPLKGLNVVAGFAYNDSEYKKAAEDVQGRRPGTAMSPYAANAWISYRLQHGAVHGLGLGFGGNYASDNKIVNSTTMGVFTLPAYTILNATVFYDHTKFRAGIKVDNLTNQEYWIGYTTMNPQKLRSITGSLTIKF